MRPMLNYYGGKWNAAAWIIEQFPSHQIYVEPFFGGGSVLLQKPRSKREVVNDLDDEIVNLFQCARDQGEELQRLLELTPFARTEYRNCARPGNNDLDRARQTIVKSYMGIGDSLFRTSNGFRQSRDAGTCTAKSWVNYWQAFGELTDRLKGVLIENRDYKQVMEYYDQPDALFYMDPPYFKETRSEKHAYRFDWTDENHIEMVEFLKSIKGMVILSGYDGPIYDSLGWKKITKEFKTQKHSFKTETLWINGSAALELAQQSFF